MILISALTLGLVGSFHCAGMCGPIALALPLKNETLLTRIISTLTYNIGKIITYAVLGLFFGIVGQGLQLAGFQKFISVLMGSIMIFSIITPAIFKNRFNSEKFTFSFIGKIKSNLSRHFSKTSYTSLFTIGVLNGLLPCGLVYMAIAIAIASTNIFLGSLTMIFFGLGTMPMLMAISILGSSVNLKFRRLINKTIPYIVVLIGLLFVLRGLNLGIKYISPDDEVLHPRSKTEMMHSNPESCPCKK